MSEIPIRINVNREDYYVNVKPHWTLLYILREKLKLKGVKKGCGTGECGACTVIMNGKAVHSCIILAAQVDGRKILTIEGLSKDGKLHPLQESFIKHGAIQCGFCIPGMILTAKALLDENPKPTKEEVKDALSSNLCRCTGYYKPIKAVLETVKML